MTELEAIRARVEGHTPGPWEVWTGCSWRRIGRDDQGTLVICPTNNPTDSHPDLSAHTEDLELAAAAPDLLRITGELERENKEQARQISKWEVYGETMKDTNFHLIDRVDEQAQRIEELEEDRDEWKDAAIEAAQKAVTLNKRIEELQVRRSTLWTISWR